jgi:hypothetical protein
MKPHTSSLCVGGVHRLVDAHVAPRATIIRGAPKFGPLSKKCLSVKAASAARTPCAPLNQADDCHHGGDRDQEPPTATRITPVQVGRVHSRGSHHSDHPEQDHTSAQAQSALNVIPDRHRVPSLASGRHLLIKTYSAMGTIVHTPQLCPHDPEGSTTHRFGAIRTLCPIQVPVDARNRNDSEHPKQVRRHGVLGHRLHSDTDDKDDRDAAKHSSAPATLQIVTDCHGLRSYRFHSNGATA